MGRRKAKIKPKYTHKGVRTRANGKSDVVFLRKTPKRWKDQSGVWYDASGRQMGIEGLEPFFLIDLTTVRAIEDR